MRMRDGIFTTAAVALSALALAALLGTDAYSGAASLEARGIHALTTQMQMGCAGDCGSAARLVQIPGQDGAK